MRGNINYQVQQLYNEVKDIGVSKHQAKLDARAGGASTWHEVAQHLGVHSYSTADDYRAIWKQIGEMAKLAGVKDMEKLTGEHARQFLESKIGEGVAAATFAKYAAACEKLGVALDRYALKNGTGREYKNEKNGFSAQIGAARKQAKVLEKFDRSRAYENPSGLIANIANNRHQLAAVLQHQGGCRLHEVSQIKESQLRGVYADKLDGGEMKGHFIVDGKGGKERTISVSVLAYNRLVSEIQSSDKNQYKISESSYGKSIQKAAVLSTQEGQGTHGLRWSFAQERHQELQQAGLNYEQSLSQISNEMGHERQDITEHYLK